MSRDPDSARADAERAASTEAQFRAVFDQSPNGIYILDRELRFTDLNTTAEQLIGDRSATIGCSLAQILERLWTPDVAEAALAPFREVLATGTPFKATAFPAQRRDTKENLSYDWEVRRITMSDGSVRGLLCTFTDVTDHVRARSEVTTLKERFRHLADAVPQLVWSTDAAGSMSYVNQRWTDYTGLDLTQTLATGWRPLVHPDDFDHVMSSWAGAFARAEPYQVELRLRRATDGAYRWHLVRGTPYRGEDGAVAGWNGTNTDIHDLKMAAEALEQSREQLRFVAESMPQKIFTATPTGDVDYFNPQWMEYTGLTFEQIRSWGWTQFIHPDDVEANVRVWKQSLESGTDFVFENRFRRFDGAYRWHLSRARPVRDASSAIIKWLGSNTDIDDQKRIEARLASNMLELLESQRAAEASEKRLRSVIDSALDAVVSIDEHDGILAWNIQAEAIFGWSEQEVIGRSIADVIIPERLREAHRAGLKRYIETGIGPVLNRRLEMIAVRRSGQELPVELAITPVRTPSGLIFHGFLRDLTESKRAQESMRLHSFILERMVEGVSVTDDRGVIEYTNAAEDEMFRYQRGELIGQHVMVQNALDRDENERRVRQVMEHLATHGSWEGDWPNRRKDGSVFTSAARITRLELAGRVVFVCVQRDVTEERQRAQRTLLLAEAGAVLMSSLDEQKIMNDLARLCVERFADWCAIDLRDASGAIVRVSTQHHDPDKLAVAHELMHRYPPGEDSPSHQACATGRAVLIEHVSDEMIAEKAQDPEHLRLIRSLGLRSLIAVPLRTRDRILGALTLVTAESNRALQQSDLDFAEDLAHRTSIAFDNAGLFAAEHAAKAYAVDRAEILSRLNAELEQFAYICSHDLQEPLRMVSQFMGLLRRDLYEGLPARSRQYFDYAIEGSERMQEMVKDLLNYARVTRDPNAPVPAMAVERALTEAMENMRTLATQAGAEITHDPLPIVPVDKLQLVQLFQNLLQNAIKFARRNVTPRIHISATRDNGKWTIAVADNGIGIEPAHRERIFEIFQRLHGRKEFEGSGIGLAVCRKIVQSYGGKIWVEGSEGGGATFCFTLPAIAAPAPTQGDAADAQKTPTRVDA